MTRKNALGLLTGIAAIIVLVVVGLVLRIGQISVSAGVAAEQEAKVRIAAPSGDSENGLGSKSVLLNAVEQNIRDVDRSNRDAVALEAVLTLTTWDPTVDQSEADAVRRAASVIDAKVVELNTQELRSSSIELWMEMAEARATTKVQVEVQDDEYAEAERPNPDALTVLATWEWVEPSTQQVNEDTRMFFMQMRKNGNAHWEMADYSYSDVPTRYLVDALE